MNYDSMKKDPADLKSMIRLQKDFFMEGGLLYRKSSFKATGKQVDQFVMPQQFHKRTLRVCHEDYGHLGMDRVQILLQERFYWPKMSEDVRTIIRTCEHCIAHFLESVIKFVRSNDFSSDVFDFCESRNHYHYYYSILCEDFPVF